MDSNIRLILVAYVLHILPLLTITYLNAFDVDKLTFYNARKMMALKIFRFLYKQYGNIKRDKIAVQTFIQESLCIFGSILMIISIVFSFLINDMERLILLGCNILYVYSIAIYIAKTRNSIRKKKI